MDIITSPETQALLSALAAGLVSFLYTGLAMTVLTIIAWWKIFTKAGESGWKSLIPFYNVYVMYKISWKAAMFWIMLLLCTVSSVLGALGVTNNNIAFMLISMVCFVVVAVITIIQQIKLAKSFGYGIGFGIGLIVLYPIFILILGLGQSKYVGAQE